jgi:hypothetical protein
MLKVNGLAAVVKQFSQTLWVKCLVKPCQSDPLGQTSGQTPPVKPCQSHLWSNLPVKPRQSSHIINSLDEEVDDLLALPAHEGQLPQYLPETWRLPDRPKRSKRRSNHLVKHRVTC